MDNLGNLRRLWDNNGLIIFDTNVYLNLYSFPMNAISGLIDSLLKIQERIWVPYQVFSEFEDGRSGVVRKSFSKYESIKSDVEKLLESTIAKLSDIAGHCDKFSYPSFDEILSQAIDDIKATKGGLSKLNSEIEAEKQLSREFHKNDVVQGLLQNLKEQGRVRTALSHTELIGIYVEGDTRYKLGIPPGYRDKKKQNTESDDYRTKRKAYGDLIIWKEILKISIETGLDILFVTDDAKPDWWAYTIEIDKTTGRESKKLVGPHTELIEEFKSYSTRDFLMLSFKDFMSFLSEFIDSMKLHYELNKDNIMHHYISNQLYQKDIDISYIVMELGNIFSYQAVQYEALLEEVIVDSDSVFMNIKGNNVLISGRFVIELLVHGTIKQEEGTVVKTVHFDIEGQCSVELSCNPNKYQEYEITNGDIKIIKPISQDIITTITDDVDLYEIYDARQRVERALNRGEEDSLNPYDRRLCEVFSDVEFYSLEHLGI